MGAGNSKPSSDQTQHVFTATDTPVRFSHQLVEALQESPESDMTREKNLELQIQARVTAELERLRAAESARLAETADKISAEPDHTSTPGHQHSSLKEHIADTLGVHSAEHKRLQQLSHDSVAKEIEVLRRKLERRKSLERMDQTVERAKEEVAQCLRTHDTRPLDCWREVETFRKEVLRLERAFVERTVR